MRPHLDINGWQQVMFVDGNEPLGFVVAQYGAANGRQVHPTQLAGPFHKDHAEAVSEVADQSLVPDAKTTGDPKALLRSGLCSVPLAICKCPPHGIRRHQQKPSEGIYKKFLRVRVTGRLMFFLKFVQGRTVTKQVMSEFVTTVEDTPTEGTERRKQNERSFRRLIQALHVDVYELNANAESI